MILYWPFPLNVLSKFQGDKALNHNQWYWQEEQVEVRCVYTGDSDEYTYDGMGEEEQSGTQTPHQLTRPGQEVLQRQTVQLFV
mgnify:CR=1 FL=1